MDASAILPSDRSAPRCSPWEGFVPQHKKSRGDKLQCAGKSRAQNQLPGGREKRSKSKNRRKPWLRQTRHAQTRAKTRVAQDGEDAASMVSGRTPPTSRLPASLAGSTPWLECFGLTQAAPQSNR